MADPGDDNDASTDQKLYHQDKSIRLRIRDFRQRQLIEYFRVYLSMKYKNLFADHLKSVKDRSQLIIEEMKRNPIYTPPFHPSKKVIWREFVSSIIERIDNLNVEDELAKQMEKESGSKTVTDEKQDIIDPSDKPLIELINACKGEICTTVHFVNKDEFEYFIFDNLSKQNQDDKDDDINTWLEVARRVVDDFENINQEKKRQRKEKIF